MLGRFSGLILPAGLKQSIWGLGEAEFPKRRAAGFTLLAGWCLTSNLRLGDTVRRQSDRNSEKLPTSRLNERIGLFSSIQHVEQPTAST